MKKHFLYTILFCLLAVAVNAQQNNTFLWRISNPANKQVSYLFGTIHLPQEKFMPVTDSVYRAIMNTDYFYGELDYQNMYKEMSKNNDFFDSKLHYMDSVKTTAGWKRMINAINRKYDKHLNPENVDEFSQFGQSLLDDYMKPDPGVKPLDIALAAYAVNLGKQGRGLETFVLQVDMLYKIIDARLRDTTLLFDEDIRLTADLTNFYIHRQFDSLSNLIEGLNANYRKVLFDDRNIGMADSMYNITKNKTAFFAVGCGHLLGSHGIIALLRAKGLTLTPVFSNKTYSVTIVTKMLKGTMNKLDKSMNWNDAPKERMEEIKEDVQIKPGALIGAPAKSKTKN
ncbi:TraB/GumN family protein [Ferruginibacter sp.]